MYKRQPLSKAELTISTEEISFSEGDSGSREIILSSQNGNQASLISYIQLDNTIDFTLDLPMEAPFVLSPGQEISIGVTWNRNETENPQTTLLIKPLGNSEPISIEIHTPE